MTKPLTSLALMMLVEEGRVALDDPVHRYIPQWRDLGVYEGGFIGSFRTKRTSAPMRVIDLMRHTSGLTYDFGAPEHLKQVWTKADVWNESIDLKEFVRRISFVPLAHQPGEKFTYGVNTDVLGYLVQVVSGMPFEQFLQDRIFTPLTMVDTGFDVPPDKMNRPPITVP